MHSIPNSAAQRETSAELHAVVESACAAHATVRETSIRREEAARAVAPGIPRWHDPAFRALNSEYRRAREDYNAHVAAVRKLFGASRGWTPGKHFTLRMLRAGSHARSREDYRGETFHPFIDHAEYFRLPVKPWRPAAILSHTYAPATEIVKFAAQHGLAVEFLDLPSWYNPHNTTAVVFTARVQP